VAFIITPADLTSTLDAVNKMLSSLGESPIATLSPPPTSEADEALQRLNEADLDVQSEGWAWNREHEYPLSRAGDGTMPLPAMTLRVTPSASNVGSWSVVDRGGKLYDRKNHTFTFDAGTVIKADLIVRLDWDSLPQAARAYITYQATQRFHAGKQGSAVVLNVNSQDVLRARTTLLHYDDEVDQANAINGNAGVVTALYGNGGMRRNRGGL
jgi:hypothetical protein